METMKWLELAVSKDESRFNLNHVFRDKNALVATDGHRLHYSNGLADADRCYVDGVSEDERAVYPDYTRVLPKDSDKTHEIEVDVSKCLLRDLKRIVTLIKSYDKGCCVKLLFDKSGCTMSYETYQESQFTFSLKLSESRNESDKIAVGVNLSYLVDALSSCELSRHTHVVPATLTLHGTLRPIIVTEEQHPERKAIIMPMKLT